MYDHERRSRAHYEGRARWYDWANRLAALVRGTLPMRERRKPIRRLRLNEGQRVLEVAVGTGTNLPLIARQIGERGRIVGVDISPAMLSRCREKLRRRDLRADLVEAEAANLPFADDSFDAVFHHGGLAEFGDKRGSIEEMVRVARPGARIVICDVGVPADRSPSFTNRMLLKLQPVYAQAPPIGLVPSSVIDLRLDWFARGAWYMLEFTKS